MRIKFKKFHPDAVIPSYAKEGDVGLDLTAISVNRDNPNYVEYNTGLGVELPKGYFCILVPRSSNSNKDLILSNGIGTIDAYRGELKFRYKRVMDWQKFLNIIAVFFEDGLEKFMKQLSGEAVNPEDEFTVQSEEYEVGNKCGQLVILPAIIADEILEVDELTPTERGANGFGSTGS